MRQHVNPLSKYFQEIDSIPKIDQIFKNSVLPTHLDIGCASGEFLFQLAENNKNWNYIGIEIREKLIINAKNKLKDKDISEDDNKNYEKIIQKITDVNIENIEKILKDKEKEISQI